MIDPQDVIAAFGRQIERQLSGDKLTMHREWWQLGTAVDLLSQAPPDIAAALKIIEAARSNLYVPGKHNLVEIKNADPVPDHR